MEEDEARGEEVEEEEARGEAVEEEEARGEDARVERPGRRRVSLTGAGAGGRMGGRRDTTSPNPDPGMTSPAENVEEKEEEDADCAEDLDAAEVPPIGMAGFGEE